MRISHKHKFIYFSIPKTGSVSIRHKLTPFSDIESEPTGPYSHHGDASTLKEHFKEKGWDWNTYFKFAFVRNPWDILVSYYFYQKKKVADWSASNPAAEEDANTFKIWKHTIQTYPTFDKYVKHGGWLKLAGRLQYDWISNEYGKKIVDYVGRLENIQKDFDKVCDKIGIPRQKLGVSNKSEHKHYTELYDDETREIVAEKYAKDIEYFGYKFGE
jgi:hypothetical protein